jgi:hypothetical protein
MNGEEQPSGGYKRGVRAHENSTYGAIGDLFAAHGGEVWWPNHAEEGVCAHPARGPYQSLSQHGWSKHSSSLTKTVVHEGGRQINRCISTTYGAINSFGGSNQSPRYSNIQHVWSQ